LIGLRGVAEAVGTSDMARVVLGMLRGDACVVWQSQIVWSRITVVDRYVCDGYTPYSNIHLAV
jgi:hypothetical protein